MGGVGWRGWWLHVEDVGLRDAAIGHAKTLLDLDNFSRRYHTIHKYDKILLLNFLRQGEALLSLKFLIELNSQRCKRNRFLMLKQYRAGYQRSLEYGKNCTADV